MLGFGGYVRHEERSGFGFRFWKRPLATRFPSFNDQVAYKLRRKQAALTCLPPIMKPCASEQASQRSRRAVAASLQILTVHRLDLRQASATATTNEVDPLAASDSECRPAASSEPSARERRAFFHRLHL